MRIPFIIYADFECLLEKNALMSNNLEKPCTEKNTKHTLSGYSLFTNCLFDATKNNQIVTEGKTIWKGFAKT